MIAVITGASSGIGFSLSQLLTKYDYTVYGISDSYSQSGHMKQIHADVSDPSQVREAVEQIYEKEGSIDCLILCAGISLASPAEKTKRKDARRIFDVNFWGCVNIINEVLPVMKSQKFGRIIIVSSLSGLISVPYLSYYGASKAALINYTCALSNELHRSGVMISALLPGGVRTGFTRKRKNYTDHKGHKQKTLIKAVKRLGAEEQTGLYPEQVAGEIFCILERRRPPVIAIIGLKSKFRAFIIRILPRRLVLFLVRKKYTGLLS